MAQKINKAYVPVLKQKARYFILMGGRGGGRSTFASQYALGKLRGAEYFRCAIMRFILSDIRNSIFQEIVDRATEEEVLNEIRVNDGLMTLDCGKNSIISMGFRKSSGDQKAKLKSLANYNAVIIEEADEIPEADFMQLDDSLRTMKGDIVVILLLNPPPKSHWIIRRWFDLEPSGVKDFYIPKLKSDAEDTIFIHSSYKSNIKNIAPATIRSYQNYETTKPDHYYNMIKGLIPEVVRGKIYSGWQVIDKLPFEAKLLAYGLDFGYTNDPTAIVGIYYLNGGYIVHEFAYSVGLNNEKIANIILALESAPVIADSAEPKSIDDLRLKKLTVLSATKGKGSVNAGIDYVKQQKISVTKQSVNIIAEYENYAWLVDKDGVAENTPKDAWNHTMDAIRYGFQIKSSVDVYVPYVQPAYESPSLASGVSEDQPSQAVEMFPEGFRPKRA